MILLDFPGDGGDIYPQRLCRSTHAFGVPERALNEGALVKRNRVTEV